MHMRRDIALLVGVVLLCHARRQVWWCDVFVPRIPHELVRGRSYGALAPRTPTRSRRHQFFNSAATDKRRWTSNQAKIGADVPRRPAATPLWTLKATQLLIFGANVSLARYVVVFYDALGFSRRLMGVLLVVFPLASFCGAMFWSAFVDRTGEYKGTLIGTSVAGVIIVLFIWLVAKRITFPVLAALTALHGFFAAPSGPIVDALCLKVLAERGPSDEGYGDQRLWSAIGWGLMALVCGRLVDVFGTSAIFFSYATLVMANVFIIGTWMPASATSSAKATARAGGASSPAASAAEGTAGTSWRDILGRFDAVWLLANLVVYGALMALVENYLNVFLLQDFVGCPKVLLGAATAVMCLFEIPVFKLIGRCWTEDRSSLIAVLTAAEVLLAVRCVLYAVLPRSRPWLVLLVEPLHGFTFAAMWCASVEFARRIAPAGAEAKMQALANGLFYNVSFAAGSLLWGFLVQHPPAGFGFTASFWLDAACILGWLAFWRAGWVVARRRRWL